MKKKALLLIIAAALVMPLLARGSAASAAADPVYDVQIARDIVTMVNENWQDRIFKYADNFTYKDELITISGKNTMETYLAGLFGNMNIEISLIDEAISPQTYIGTWLQVIEVQLTPWYKRKITMDGVSVLRYRPDGILQSQQDFYNEADIYAELPGISPIIKFLRAFSKRKYLGPQQ